MLSTNFSKVDESFKNPALVMEQLTSLLTGETEEPLYNSETDEPLNILILYPDDWRHDDIGGIAPVVRTPHLNKLAKRGIQFTYNAVTTSICWMSRATLFSGQYVSRHFSHYLADPFFATFNWNTSWPYLLQKNGYFVGHAGKWQYADIDGYMKKNFNWSEFHEGDHIYEVSPKRTVAAADRSMEDVFNFLEKRPSDKPFALTCAFYPPKAVGIGKEPGVQWKALEEYKKIYENETIPFPYNMEEAYKRLPKFLQNNVMIGRGRWRERWITDEHYQVGMRNYYALITHVDKAIGQIVDRLEQDGLMENTMIIFTTDNGLFHGAHGLAGKWFPYQESIRVPLIIYDPRMPQEKRGIFDDSMTLNIDLASTILGAAKIEQPPLMQGRDISDLYLRKHEKKMSPPWRTEFYYEYPSPEGIPTFPSSTALVRKDWKYIKFPENGYQQFFNLVKDPYELDDLAGVILDYQKSKLNESPGMEAIIDEDLESMTSSFKEMTLQYEKLKLHVMEPVIPQSHCDPSTWFKLQLNIHDEIYNCMKASEDYWNKKVEDGTLLSQTL